MPIARSHRSTRASGGAIGGDDIGDASVSRPPVSSIEIIETTTDHSSTKMNAQRASTNSSSSSVAASSMNARTKARQIFARRNSDRMLKLSSSTSDRSLAATNREHNTSDDKENATMVNASSTSTTKAVSKSSVPPTAPLESSVFSPTKINHSKTKATGHKKKVQIAADSLDAKQIEQQTKINENDDGSDAVVLQQHNTPPTNKGKHDKEETPPSVTPYWRALEMDDRPASPRLTRSSAKKKRRQVKHFEEDEAAPTTAAGAATALFPMTFSPPDQKANAAREKKQLERKEKDRAKRIEKSRQAGNLMEFSPPGRSSSRQTKRRTTTTAANRLPPAANKKDNGNDYYENEYMLDMSPGGGTTTSSLESMSIIAGKVGGGGGETMTTKSLGSQRSGASSSSSRRGSIQLTKDQIQQIADDGYRALEDELVQLKETLSKTEEKLIDSEEDAAELQHRIVQLEKELDIAQKELKYVEREYEEKLREQSERMEEEKVQILTEQQQEQQECLKKSEVDQEASKKQSTIIENLEKELTQMREEYKTANNEVTQLQQTLEQTKTESERQQENIEQKLSEREEQLNRERDERKIEKEESSAKETTIRQLSSVLEAAKEKERTLEEQIKMLQEQLKELQRTATKHTNDEVSALQKAKVETEQTVSKLQIELASLKERYNQQETSLKELKALLERERKAFQAHKMELESKIASYQKSQTEYKRDHSGFEEKILSMELEMNAMKEKLNQSEKEQKELLEKLDHSKTQTKEKHNQVNDLKEQLTKEKGLRKNEAEKLEQMSKELTKSQASIDHLNRELMTTTHQLQQTVMERDHNLNRLTTFDQREESLLQKLRAMDDVRRSLHNRVIQLSGNIRVFVRVRPIIDREKDAIAVTHPNNDQNRGPRPSSVHGPSPSRGIKRKQTMDANAEEDCPFEFPGLTDRSSNRRSTSNNSSDTTSMMTEDDLTKQVILATEPYKDRGGLKPRRKTWKFGFDHVFSPIATQLDVWMAAEPLVQSTIDGYNVCIFAYGMTGAGKTHTMLGDGNDPNQHGLIYRSVSKLFQAKRDIELGSKGMTTVEMSVELLEIYNEQLRDLLSTSPPSSKNPHLEDGGLRIQSNESVGNVVATADTEEDVLTILDLAQSRRCVKATNSNAESSRSHMIFTIHFEVYNSDQKKGPSSSSSPVRCGKLHICDLAGSERLGKSGSHGSLLKETQAINKSLMNLSNVIEKLQAGDSHVPYRDSKLTHLLQNSLGGDSKTLCVVCCNPLGEHFNESLCSLRFASKVSRVELKALSKVNV